MLIDGRQKALGGFSVRRVLPYAKKRMVGPFIFLDHMGPAQLKAGQGMDVRPHPHIGLSTLTYLFEGQIVHRDSLGVEKEIRPGAVNWMTAGRGVVHSERSSLESRSRPQTMHGIQTWIALPLEAEDVDPSFDHYPEVPEFSENGFEVALVGGRWNGLVSPVKTYSPLTYLAMSNRAHSKWESARPAGQELALYVVEGGADVDGLIVQAGQLAVLPDGEGALRFRAAPDSKILIIGGEAFKEPRYMYWNFVASSEERLERAKQQWREQAFGRVPGESEFIPLPET